MRRVAVVAVIGSTLVARPAAAAPSDLVGQSIVLDEGQVALALALEISAAPAQLGSPTSIGPDGWYGVTADLTLGVFHSDEAMDRVPYYFEPGTSICIDREAITCPRRYHGSGLDGLYRIRRGELEIAVRGRLLYRDIAPAKPALTAGAALRYAHGRYEVYADPYLQLGLENLDRGNRAELWLPIMFAIQPTERWALELHTGYNSDLDVWRDGYHVPLEVRTRVRIYGRVEIGMALGFASLYGPQNIPRERMAFFDVRWRS
ncbi:MAG TPA: hypothetical protein VFQ65_05630 [Kofleriaceae bacterium]|nr:hypothetical protein [Kofleriaceae bacterium]